MQLVISSFIIGMVPLHVVYLANLLRALRTQPVNNGANGGRFPARSTSKNARYVLFTTVGTESNARFSSKSSYKAPGL